MARPVRVEFPNAVYHVTARGNEKKAVFRDDKDRERFLTTLEQTINRYGIILHGFCLMPNHYHLILQTPGANLSTAVGWLQTTYSIRFNRRHKRSGHLFQGRYRAHLVEEDSYAVELIKYIHLNPVRPKDKQKAIPPGRKAEMDSYPWSSHRIYAGLDKPGDMPYLSTEWLHYFSDTEKKARSEYRRQIEQAFGETPSSPWEEMKHGFILGSEALSEKVQEMLAGSGGREEVNWQQKVKTERMTQAAKELAEKEQDRRIAMWIRVRLGKERMTDVAGDYGYKDGSGVHQAIRRLEERAETDIDLCQQMQKLAVEAGLSHPALKDKRGKA